MRTVDINETAKTFGPSLGVFKGLLFKLMATPFKGIVLTGLGPESALRVLGAPHEEN